MSKESDELLELHPTLQQLFWVFFLIVESCSQKRWPTRVLAEYKHQKSQAAEVIFLIEERYSKEKTEALLEQTGNYLVEFTRRFALVEKNQNKQAWDAYDLRREKEAVGEKVQFLPEEKAFNFLYKFLQHPFQMSMATGVEVAMHDCLSYLTQIDNGYLEVKAEELKVREMPNPRDVVFNFLPPSGMDSPDLYFDSGIQHSKMLRRMAQQLLCTDIAWMILKDLKEAKKIDWNAQLGTLRDIQPVVDSLMLMVQDMFIEHQLSQRSLKEIENILYGLVCEKIAETYGWRGIYPQLPKSLQREDEQVENFVWYQLHNDADGKLLKANMQLHGSLMEIQHLVATVVTAEQTFTGMHPCSNIKHTLDKILKAIDSVMELCHGKYGSDSLLTFSSFLKKHR